MLEELNEMFAVKDAVRFEIGEKGLKKAVLTHASGGSAEAYLLGAHVTSFCAPGFGEVLYVSSKTEFQAGKAIRGGIPLIFPQFGPGPLPSHGFARNTEWLVHSTARGKSGEAVLTFELSETEQTKNVWPQRFRCEFEIRLAASLTTTMRVENLGNAPFSFQTALHTYYGVSAIENVVVSGFEGLDYLDNLKAKERGHDNRASIRIESEVDRIYLKTPNQLQIDDSGRGRRILIKKQNLPDAVLWNPWIEKGASLKDLEQDGYKKFVCVEAGAISPEVELSPGKIWEGTQEIWVMKG